MKLDDVASHRHFSPRELGEVLLLINETALLAFCFFIAKHVVMKHGDNIVVSRPRDEEKKSP